MRKILLLLGVVLLITSCKKDEENDDNNPTGNNLVGTWELIDNGGMSWMDNTKYWVFTSENQFYRLEEDDFAIRGSRSCIYVLQNNTVNIDGELMKYTISGNSVTFEMSDNGIFINMIFNKTQDVNPNNWLEELDIGNALFSVSIGESVAGLVWTGQKAWICDDAWTTKLAEIDLNNGAVLQQVDVTNGHGTLGYGNNYLLNGCHGDIFLHNPLTGILESSINFTNYAHFHGVCYDGQYIWFHAGMSTGNDGALVKCDFTGNIITSVVFPRPEDLTFFNGSLWILADNRLIKFNTNTLQAVQTYRLKNFEQGGYSGAIEFINGQLWIVDGNSTFYKISMN